MKKAFRLFLSALLVFTLSGAPAFAQVTSNLATVGLTLDIGESLTISATPASIVFNYGGTGGASASGPISVITTWALTSGTHGIAVAAFFSTPSAALTGPVNVPSSSVMASIDGTAALPCTQNDTTNVPTSIAGGTCPLVFANGSAAANGTSTDTILLSLTNLSGAAGHYTGTLNIQGFAL